MIMIMNFFGHYFGVGIVLVDLSCSAIVSQL